MRYIALRPTALRRAALVGSLMALGGLAVLSAGPYLPPCLGLFSTALTCAAGMAAAGEPWAPGPPEGSAIAVAVPLALLVALAVPWSQFDRSSRVRIAIIGIVGAIGGALAYEALHPAAMSGWSSIMVYDPAVQGLVEQGRTFVAAALAPNDDVRRISAMLVAAGSVIVAGAVMSRMPDGPAQARATPDQRSDR